MTLSSSRGRPFVQERVWLKGGFHEPTKMYKINHRCIQIGRQVLQTSRHRRMDIGAVLAAD